MKHNDTLISAIEQLTDSEIEKKIQSSNKTGWVLIVLGGILMAIQLFIKITLMPSDLVIIVIAMILVTGFTMVNQSDKMYIIKTMKGKCK
jgi:hypothetical protein